MWARQAPRYETGSMMHERMSARWFVLAARANKRSHRATLDQTRTTDFMGHVKTKVKMPCLPFHLRITQYKVRHGLHLLATLRSFVSRP